METSRETRAVSATTAAGPDEGTVTTQSGERQPDPAVDSDEAPDDIVAEHRDRAEHSGTGAPPPDAPDPDELDTER